MLRKLEKYEILEEIGHGGMATVFRARDTKLDRLVALKVLHPHLRGSKEARARFRREAQGVARLRHPWILEIYDYSGEESEESYIATELLTGPTLKKFADAHPQMPAEIAACFCIEVACALSAAHEKGIIHRDVKPENILLHENRCVKLTDFGIADMVDAHTMTATGQILGSPGHMSPEQIEGKECDARSDVFSLGTVLYFLACGRLPFTGRNPHQVLKRISEGDYPDPLRVQPAIGGRMRAIIVRALAHAPEDRYASAAELEQDLRAFVAEVGIDEPEALLVRYLGDPAGVTVEITQRVIAACIERGKKARDAGDVPRALDYFGRVLALDNGNAEALALVESVGRAQKRHSQLVYALAGLTGLALAAGGGAAIASLGPESGAVTIEPGPTAAEPPGPQDAGTGGAAPLAVEEPDGGVRDVAAGVAIDAGPDAGAPTAMAIFATDPTTSRTFAVVRRGPPAPPGPPRFVRFFFDPANVRASVDGAPLQDVGPGFEGMELRPGRHTIRIVSNHSCCLPIEESFEVEPGQGEMALRRRLPSAPATLLVRCRTPGARVRIAGREFFANEAFPVPIPGGERSAGVPFVVTAEGHRAYTGQVRLVAGGEIEVEVPPLQAEELPP
jgi:serine/threonine-protein kinase